MRLFISSPQGTATNLARILERITRLYRHGVLDDRSTVWINADLRLPTFWILSWRPACIFWIDAATAGTVRLTRDRVRWAPTYNGSGKNPEVQVRVDELPVDSVKHVMVVVDHRHPTEPVQVVDRSTDGPNTMTGGFHQGALASVIDLKNFVPPTETHPPTDSYAKALAHVHGMTLLTTGMSPRLSVEFENHIEEYGIDLPAEFLARMVESLSMFDTIAGVLTDKMRAAGQFPGTP